MESTSRVHEMKAWGCTVLAISDYMQRKCTRGFKLDRFVDVSRMAAVHRCVDIPTVHQVSSTRRSSGYRQWRTSRASIDEKTHKSDAEASCSQSLGRVMPSSNGGGCAAGFSCLNSATSAQHSGLNFASTPLVAASPQYDFSQSNQLTRTGSHDSLASPAVDFFR